MTGNLCSNTVKCEPTKAPAMLIASGCVSSRVGLADGVYHCLPRPTRSSEGVSALSTKMCTKCRTEKDLSEFYADKRNKDGVRSRCKTCVIDESRQYRICHAEEERAYKFEYNRHYYVKNKDKIRVNKAAYYANNKEQLREISRKYQLAHCEENKKHCKDYYEANKENERQRVLRWHKEHPEAHRAACARRRARKLQAGGDHTAEDIQRQGECQKWRCWWCGKKCKKQYHVDHLVPLSQGGHNGPSNIVIACPRCNLSKHDNLPSDWAGKLF